MFTIHFNALYRVALVISLVSAAQNGFAGEPPLNLEIQKTAGAQSLAVNGTAFHTSVNEIVDPRLIQLSGSASWVALWNERFGGGLVPYYAISLDGQKASIVTQTAYEILLRYNRFDPIVREPLVPNGLTAKPSGNVYIVQFVTQPLEEYRQQIAALGGQIYKYMPNHAYLVKMSADTRGRVADLPFVRWVGPYETVYKLEEFLFEEYVAARLTPGQPSGPSRYNIQLVDRGADLRNTVVERIQAVGGKVDATDPQSLLIEATLTPQQLMEVAQTDPVLFIDRWTPAETDMDIARQIGGGLLLETKYGVSGTGVRGEVMDVSGPRVTHMDFQDMPPLFHAGSPSSGGHGNSTYGIVFATGTANPMGRGMLPSGQGIYAQMISGPTRMTHTAQLLQSPYFAVFQSNSWGGGLTTAYTTVSASMDDIVFMNDIVITQSQSNAGSRNSRPEAWAKNIVSVGGIRHMNTLDMSDDRWQGASIGPAADGRIKPDLAHFYDFVFTTGPASDTGYTTGFGGTSAATPIVAGHFGLFFELWHYGIFGNPTGDTVFESRPHFSTAKAMLINTSKQWPFSGEADNLSRHKQGWGLPDVENVLNLYGRIFVVNETDVLENLGSSIYSLSVDGTTPLRATLVYADPAGTTSATQHRINDLTLALESPTGELYWANHGLVDGNWSEPGGLPDTLNTVENVFIQKPAPGLWNIYVFAVEINEDQHRETPQVDADYALVVSGVVLPAGSSTQGQK